MFGCGGCRQCSINKRRKWTIRILAEQGMHKKSSFVTLTYDEENLPDRDKYKGGNLCKEDYQKFLKSLRKRLPPKSLRYFLVGEYGDKSGRAHYHICLFGLDKSDSKLIKECWNKGFVYIGTLTKDSAQYDRDRDWETRK